jgi:thiol-disulfide isomerase/thioredoxin
MKYSRSNNMYEKKKFNLILTATVSILVIFSCILGYAVITTLSIPSQANDNITVTVYFFYGEECPYCHNVMPFMQGLVQKYPNVDIQFLEVWHNQTNRELSTKMLTDLGRTSPGVPLVIIGETVLVGEKDIPEQLEGIILNSTVRNYG